MVKLHLKPEIADLLCYNINMYLSKKLTVKPKVEEIYNDSYSHQIEITTTDIFMYTIYTHM